MPDQSDQLAQLGQKVLDAVIATYNPTHDPSLALAIHPGQPLADDLVQAGVTNPLRLSEWIEDQYDYPLWLKRSDASSISASSVGSVSAKSAYLAMVPWAQPSVPADAPSYARMAAMIADARKDLGDNPDALPFACEPTDFAEPDSQAWHVFDQVISTTTTTTTTEAPPPVRPNFQLWQMRVVTDRLVDSLPPPHVLVDEQNALKAEILNAPRSEVLTRVREMHAQPAAAIGDAALAISSTSLVKHFSATNVAAVTATDAAPSMMARLASSRFGAFGRFAASERNDAVRVIEPQPTTAVADSPPRRRVFDAALIDRIGAMQIHDFVEAPVVTEVTTSGSDLHVHFEYCLLTITRRLSGTPWWHADLIAAPDWYVPGMKRGALVPESTDEAFSRCLPQALLVVRNVSFTGDWSAAAKESLTNQVSFLGPFMMHVATDTQIEASSTEQVSVLGIGIQVIGELCSLLPPLPPQDAPDA